mmetsp:Transcript_26309/g.63367  ORF Transcript_26309/g.63367 Transcript_26309/m.63367 type:complete len:456 (+) Transcript_26309:56-1423(+)
MSEQPRSSAAELRRSFPLEVDTDEILNAFTDTAKGLGCRVRRACPGFVAVIREDKGSIFGCLGLRTPWNYKPPPDRSEATAITCTVDVSPDGYKAMCISGPSRTVTLSLIEQVEPKLRQLNHHWVSRGPQAPGADLKWEQSDPCGAEASKLDNAAYYYFFKLLSNPEDPIGQQVDQFVTDFLGKYGDRSGVAVLPAPMNEILNMAEELPGVIEASVRSAARGPGSQVIQDILPRCKVSVERFLFSKLGARVWSCYRSRYSAEDEAYVHKVRQLRQWPAEVLMRALGVDPCFVGGVDAQKSTLLAESTAASTRDTCSPREEEERRAPPADDAKRPLPFARASAGLTQFVSSSAVPHDCPRRACHQLLGVLTELQTAALEATGGQRELTTMDDKLPVFLFALVHSELDYPFAVWHLLLDSLSADQRMETEGRAVTLLEIASTYLAFELDMDHVMSQW